MANYASFSKLCKKYGVEKFLKSILESKLEENDEKNFNPKSIREEDFLRFYASVLRIYGQGLIDAGVGFQNRAAKFYELYFNLPD